jgi:hypothetical protein
VLGVRAPALSNLRSAGSVPPAIFKALDLRAPAEMLEPFAFYDLNITLSPNENPSLSSKYHPRYAPIS